jgi:hypothetical protein
MTTYYICIGNAVDQQGNMRDFTQKCDADEVRLGESSELLFLLGGELRAVYKQYIWCLREDAMEALKPSGIVPAKSVPNLVTN